MQTDEANNTDDAQLHQQMGLEINWLLMAFFAIIAMVFGVLYWTKPTAAEFDALDKKYADLVAAAGGTDPSKLRKPPIITLAEAQGFSFPSGSAAVSWLFREKLREDIIPQLLATAKEHHLDLIEVVGHTDERPLPSRGKSSLDLNLMRFLSGMDLDWAPLNAADNVGLGMSRAAAVAKILQGDPRLRDLTIVCLSAGQTMLASGKLASNDMGQWWTPGNADAKRRRIEIRLRKLGE